MSQRVKVIPVTNLFFEDFFKKKEYHVKIENPLPDDAKLINSQYDESRNMWYLVFESAEFEPIRETHLLPRHNTVFTDLTQKIDKPS